jgi:hypothetical protein
VEGEMYKQMMIKQGKIKVLLHIMCIRNVYKLLIQSLNIVKKCMMWFLCLEARPLISSTARNFMCSNNVSIDRQYVCDLHKDCPEGEDEKQDCGE